MTEALLRFLQRHPPRSGWTLFGLALATVLVLPLMIETSAFGLASGAMLRGVLFGLLLGLLGGRFLRPLLVIPAILVPLGLLELLPPWDVVEADLRVLATRSFPEEPLFLPTAVSTATSTTATTLQAAWRGNPGALNWSLAHLFAVAGYVGAGILGLGLRRGAPPLAYAMPMLATITITGITARVSSSYLVIGVVLTLVVSLVGGFISRERAWDRLGFAYSDALKLDVAMAGLLLLGGVTLLGWIIPATPRNFITTWLWTDVRLPAGLARLDRPDPSSIRDAGRNGIGGLGPGRDLELGRSLEEAGREEVALTIRVEGLPERFVPYWRGRVFDQYNGRGWTTGPIRQVAEKPLAPNVPLDNFIVQDVTDAHPERRTMYGVPDIVAASHTAAREETASGESVGWTGRPTEQSYTVLSRPPNVSASEISEIRRQQEAMANYRTVPESVPESVLSLAQQLTADASSQAERALAIETYLRSLDYSYEVQPLQPGRDAVEQFLFSMRAGYCTYYASSMAIMARSVGIPSRVAVGYASGEYDRNRGVWIVREGDAHAWPELYLDGQGWTRWEPTPIRPVPMRNLQPEPAPDLTLAPEPAPAFRTDQWVVLLIGLTLLGALVALPWLKRQTVPATARHVHADLYRYGKRAGVLPAGGDSVEEYARRLARVVPGARQPLERVAGLLTARLYRETPLNTDEERNLIRSWYTARGVFRGKGQ